MSRDNQLNALLGLLRMEGAMLSGEVVERLGISRATLSRLIREVGYRVVRIGKGRATRLALRHPEVSRPVPLYAVGEDAEVDWQGQLVPLCAGERVQWRLVSEEASGSLLEGEFGNGLFPGWPWFLEDLRPSGFLGRAFARNMAERYSLNPDPERWTDLELLSVLSRWGSDFPGNFILGDDHALRDFNEKKIRVRDEDYPPGNADVYADLARRVLEEEEEPGSSAGGEQPKFTAVVSESPDASPRAVLVKFSPPVDSPGGRRWADLLYAEDLANTILSEAGILSASTRVLASEKRVFLESLRFDRVGALGRRGVVSLRSLDAAHFGHGGGSWADMARQMVEEGWITRADGDVMVRLHCFGQLIANTDMHWGNLSFYLPGRRPFPLAPVYDMVPMLFRPSATGEVVSRNFQLSLPKPEDRRAWLAMHPYAVEFWQRLSAREEISEDFREIAANAAQALGRGIKDEG